MNEGVSVRSALTEAGAEYGGGPAALDRSLILRLSVFAAFLLLAYWPMLVSTGRILIDSEDMAHGFFAPIISAFLVWQKKERFQVHAQSGSAWGLAILGFAAVIAVAAAVGSSATLARFAFLGSLAGATVLWGGAALLRDLSFPLLLLLYTFPLPAVLYGEITQPLQLLASFLSEGALEILGYSVLREGNILQLPNQRLSVVEACSGIRSLVTLSFFCMVYAYLFEESNWNRAILVLASLPAAIFINTLRITATGMIGEVRPDLTKGIFHDTLGWALFLVGFGIVVILQLLIHKIRAKGAPLENESK